MFYKSNVYEFISCLVYRKGQSKISGKSRETLEENMINTKGIKSQIIKIKCYL